MNSGLREGGANTAGIPAGPMKNGTQYLLSVILFLFLFWMGYLHATKGIDFLDEGLYVSAAMRYTHGDLPFRDEIRSVLNQSNIIFSLVMVALPDMTLLHIRLLGVLLYGGACFLFFLLISRYAPPFFSALICGVMFFANAFEGKMSPGYDLLSSTFSLISLTAWLVALTAQSRLSRNLSSIAGGLFLGLAVFSYSTLMLMSLVSLGFVVFFLSSPASRRSYLLPSLTVLITFGVVVLSAVVTIISSGLAADFIQNFSDMALNHAVKVNKGVVRKLGRLIKEFLLAAPYGLALFFSLYAMISRRNRRGPEYPGRLAPLLVPVVFLSVFSAASVLLRRSVVLAQDIYPIVLLSFAVLLALWALVSERDRAGVPAVPGGWNIARPILIAWGFAASFIYGMSSTKGLTASVQGMTPFFAAGMISAYHYSPERSVDGASLFRKIASPRASLYLTLVILTVIGGVNYHRAARFNQDVTTLTEPFRHEKLKGISATPREVREIEALLQYVQDRVRPHDYFLVYNEGPLLYFLTHTRPSLGSVWVRDALPLTVRKKLVDKMIREGRVPEYCIRLLGLPGLNLNQGMVLYDEQSPLDSFVKKNYSLEKVIYPFEVWRRGRGRAARFLDGMRPVPAGSLTAGGGEYIVACSDLTGTVPPLRLLEHKGEFRCFRSVDRNGPALKIKPADFQGGGQYLQLGYVLADSSAFERLMPEKELVMTVEARLANPLRGIHMFNMPYIFIQDKADSVERNPVALYSDSWESYRVSRKIRGSASEITLGIRWAPENEHDWLEVREIKIYAQ